MEKRNNDFSEIEILKERYNYRIQMQELKVKAAFTELSDNLTGATLFNNIKENLFSGSGFAFKLGFIAVTLLRNRLKRQKMR
ncbi:MAG: hypothetical protein MUC31_08215 [Bacteroidales bacterium]|nr:hypothetical protein [Bacteroidales bacterium]